MRAPEDGIVGSLTAEGSAIRDRDVKRLFEQLTARAVTVHAVMVGQMNAGGSQNVNNATQIGIAATKQTGGRYESIAAATLERPFPFDTTGATGRAPPKRVIRRVKAGRIAGQLVG